MIRFESIRKRRASQPVRALILFSQPTVLALALAVLFMHWRVATVMQVEILAVFPEAYFEETTLRTRIASGDFFPVNVRHIAIRYPEYPQIRAKTSTAAGQFMLVPVEHFAVKSCTCEAACREIQITLEGRAQQAYLVRENQSRDEYRLTLFDTVTHSSIALGSGIMIWLFLTTLGWVKIYRELKQYR
ncbi:MAG: hypothetical protein RBT80_12570 [Candidatus Vecturithrix sp.]|jgi:hypothetical protein|nr:hypothetical protein [Candidatus Vecturithrix sp.]